MSYLSNYKSRSRCMQTNSEFSATLYYYRCKNVETQVGMHWREAAEREKERKRDARAERERPTHRHTSTCTLKMAITEMEVEVEWGMERKQERDRDMKTQIGTRVVQQRIHTQNHTRIHTHVRVLDRRHHLAFERDPQDTMTTHTYTCTHAV